MTIGVVIVAVEVRIGIEGRVVEGGGGTERDRYRGDVEGTDLDSNRVLSLVAVVVAGVVEPAGRWWKEEELTEETDEDREDLLLTLLLLLLLLLSLVTN